jgi:hypothetical protein
MLSSKVWEDVHPWNVDFECCLSDVAGMCFIPGGLYKLESIFLEKLQWCVFIDGEVYAGYYFTLLDTQRTFNDTSDAKGCAFRPARRSRRERIHTDPYAIEPIHEDQEYLEDPCADVFFGKDSGYNSPCPPCSPTLIKSWLAAPIGRTSSSSSLSSGEGSSQPLVIGWQSRILEGGDPGALTSSALRDAWRLDACNPHVGAFRHAPQASAPSKHILPSAEKQWASQLATRTAEVLGPPRFRSDSSINTVSGATGDQLATELRLYMKSRSGAAEANGTNGHGVASPKGPTTFSELLGETFAK